MNNSDRPLTPDEERMMAYLDDRMSPEEAAAFERECPEAAKDCASMTQMQSLLKKAGAPKLRNADFFNRQILREISSSNLPVAAPVNRAPFGIWKLVFASACCLLAAVGIYRTFVPDTQKTPVYVAEVLSVKTGDESLKARLILEEGMTVVMIDGLEPITEDFILN